MKLTELQGYSTLKGLGLSEEEIFIYHALLGENESTSIRRIAAKTKLNRGTVYESIKRLVDRGMVGFNRKGERKHYFAERPYRIYELIEQKRREIQMMEVRAKSLVPKLQAILKREAGQPLVRFYEHDEGINIILHDVLNTTAALEPKAYCAYSHQSVRPYLYRHFPNYTRQRIKSGIFVKVIKIGEGEGPIGLDEVRWLNEDQDTHASSYMMIYGNKVALISVSDDETPYGVVIEEPGVAIMQRLLFQKIWDSLPKDSSSKLRELT
ncbi:winged helix-turn-helix transcriptional regulator [Candidatus Microgenomates bacterium]|nr:winged helix-turn-helix transcriptional regulator [Candidatus Microgenomates bacterium]